MKKLDDALTFFLVIGGIFVAYFLAVNGVTF